MASHASALEDLARKLAHTDRTRSSVGLRHAVRRILHVEIPAFDHTLVALTLAQRNRVHRLADLEVTRA